MGSRELHGKDPARKSLLFGIPRKHEIQLGSGGGLED